MRRRQPLRPRGGRPASRARAARWRPAAPSWTAAAFLAAFAWYFLAYHRPGSPRALAIFLAAYALAAVAGGVRWGAGWLADTARASGPSRQRWPAWGCAAARALLRLGTLPLMVVWLGGTAFDAFANTRSGSDVLGSSRGWTRTLVNTVGLVWLTAIVAGAVLLVARTGERGQPVGDPAPSADSGSDTVLVRTAPGSVTLALGRALVPLAAGWFLAHDLTLLLFEGQNFYALLSDPLGRGWDLFGTLNHTIDFSLVRAGWVRWSQLALLVVGHVGALVLLHDRMLTLVRPPAGRANHLDHGGRRRRLHRRRRPPGAGVTLPSVLAHQGGWDEILFVLVPIGLFAGLLALANRRAGQRAQDGDGDTTGDPD